jgi:hypothetical protein
VNKAGRRLSIIYPLRSDSDVPEGHAGSGTGLEPDIAISRINRWIDAAICLKVLKIGCLYVAKGDLILDIEDAYL